MDGWMKFCNIVNMIIHFQEFKRLMSFFTAFCSPLSYNFLKQLTRKRADLKKKLKVTFVGEAGLDMGGLTKEWFLLLIRQIFHPDYGE